MTSRWQTVHHSKVTVDNSGITLRSTVSLFGLEILYQQTTHWLIYDIKAKGSTVMNRYVYHVYIEQYHVAANWLWVCL